MDNILWNTSKLLTWVFTLKHSKNKKRWKLGWNFTVLNQVVLNWYKMILLNWYQLFYTKDNSRYAILYAITKLENHIIIKPMLHIYWWHLPNWHKTEPKQQRAEKTVYPFSKATWGRTMLVLLCQTPWRCYLRRACKSDHFTYCSPCTPQASQLLY